MYKTISPFNEPSMLIGCSIAIAITRDQTGFPKWGDGLGHGGNLSRQSLRPNDPTAQPKRKLENPSNSQCDLYSSVKISTSASRIVDFYQFCTEHLWPLNTSVFKIKIFEEVFMTADYRSPVNLVWRQIPVGMITSLSLNYHTQRNALPCPC